MGWEVGRAIAAECSKLCTETWISFSKSLISVVDHVLNLNTIITYEEWKGYFAETKRPRPWLLQDGTRIQ